ncbi:MAG: hypothetical protein U0974_12040 [Gemmatimonadales bacterium]|nr:hypothetical protein [Gemmatimonadales bacterium]
MKNDMTMAVPALVLPEDGLGEVVRMAVRGAIEAAVESELTLALGRGGRGSGPPRRRATGMARSAAPW